MTGEGAHPLVRHAVRITIESGPHAGTTVQWNRRGSYLIGRSANAELRLSHDLVASMEHCRLEITDQGCALHDLGGRQGTMVNGHVVASSPLRSGDRIQVGLTTLRVVVGGSVDCPATESLAAKRDLSSQGTLSSIAAPESGLLDIPGYSIIRKIGEGGMGVVYEATQRATGERVAIKTIIPIPGAARRSIDLFRREMKLLSQVEHPHIVRFVESGEFAGQIFLVMEYVDAVDLESLVKSRSQSGRLSVCCHVICQVLEALAYAHQRKLVHRDIKPRNILVKRHGGQFEVKLADFGLAKNFEQAGLSQLTADDEIRGTLAFMPWEQLQNSRYAKPTVDIYSTGATLFYFLTGRPPGHTQLRQKSWWSITSLFSRPGPAAASVPTESRTGAEAAGVPPGLVDVLDRALASDPQQRFSTAAAMREALLPFAGQY